MPERALAVALRPRSRRRGRAAAAGGPRSRRRRLVMRRPLATGGRAAPAGSQSAARRGTAVASRNATRASPASADGLAPDRAAGDEPRRAVVERDAHALARTPRSATPAESSVHGTEPSASVTRRQPSAPPGHSSLSRSGRSPAISVADWITSSPAARRCERRLVGEPGDERLDHARDAGLPAVLDDLADRPRAPRPRGQARRTARAPRPPLHEELERVAAVAHDVRGTALRVDRRARLAVPLRPARAARPRRAGRRPRAARPHCAPARRRSPRRAARRSRAGRARARCRP